MFKDEADFEKVVGRLNIDTEPNPEHKQKLRRQMLSVFKQTGHEPSTRIVVFRTLRSIIMKSPVTKLAAAAVIIIAVLIGLNILVTSTPAFAEIVKPFLTARTASFKMTMEVEGVPTQNFDCLYAEPIRMRQTNKEHGAVVISDLQKGKIVTLMPSQKKAYVMELENIPEDQDQSGFNMFGEIRKHILEAQESEDASVEFIGEKKINGMTAIGYHVTKPGVEITVWADPKTKLPVQMTNTMEPTTYTMTDIVFDVEFDESLLSLEIPAEYTVHTMQVDASEPTEEDLINMFRIWAEQMDGNLPSALEMNAMMEFLQYQRKKMKEQGIELTEEMMLEQQKTIQKMSRGGMFVQKLSADSDWHYAGKDVKFGNAKKPIFWYKPEGSETYRMIYGDLSIREVSAEDVPKSSEAEPITKDTSEVQATIDKANATGANIPAEKRNVVARMLSLSEEDLITGLGAFSELTGGRYPSKLDAKATVKETDGLGANVLGDVPKDVKKQKVQDIFFAAAYHDKLVREKKDVAYYGDKVTAKDSDKLLVHWKIGKDKYRVVFGDLTFKTLSADKLAEFENN